MTKKMAFYVFLALLCSCEAPTKKSTENMVLWEPYNDSAEVAANADHEKERMRYKHIQSKVLNKNHVFRPLYPEVAQITAAQYQRLKPMILEQDILTLRKHLDAGELNYEQITLFYLYRIYKFELDNSTTLNAVLALNKDVVQQARSLDKIKEQGKEPAERHPLYGMPVLLKDNINTKGMNTTAGAIALMHNEVEDAFIVNRLKDHGALILGKVNLSEWANFLCRCPNGQSAVGGQTLNPYGMRVFDTGGSSSGSGAAIAANYAVVAVGTETSGSILSPSSQNSVVGLKPTVGLLSRSGIVPISGTLDTPGPMTRNVMDNAILLSAMLGKDPNDPKSVGADPGILSAPLHPQPISEMKLGVFSGLMESDSIYKETVKKMEALGAQIVPFAPSEVSMEGFLSILNIDMKNDLPQYLQTYTDSTKVPIGSIADAVAFNAADSTVRIPYGQELFRGILADSTTAGELAAIKARLEENGRSYFNAALENHGLDAVLSINNYHAGYAAVAKYPALTVPMGYKRTGEPIGLTFIGKPFSEALLLRLGKGFENAFPLRKMPEGFQ